MILVPSFDILSGFRLEKITEECPFQGPVFFGLLVKLDYRVSGWDPKRPKS